MIRGKKMIFFFLVLDRMRADSNNLEPMPPSLLDTRYDLLANIYKPKDLWRLYYDYVWALDNEPVIERNTVIDLYRTLSTKDKYNFYNERMKALRFKYIIKNRKNT
jgi:hypothetical protein